MSVVNMFIFVVFCVLLIFSNLDVVLSWETEYDRFLYNIDEGVSDSDVYLDHNILKRDAASTPIKKAHFVDKKQPEKHLLSNTTLSPKDAELDESMDSKNASDFLKGLNITVPSGFNLTDDHHIYYNSSFSLDQEKAMSYWVDLDKMPQEKVITHQMLSDSHRRAATVTLSFEFPFYGHLLKNITIATGGFLYMGDYIHSWIAATQYVAPLMANFDTSVSNDSKIIYADNGTFFTVQWERVMLQDKPNEEPFTFQATLHQNGDIVFVYKKVPVQVTSIEENSHPVKVGLSDAYIIERAIIFLRRKTIYEYHRINYRREEIKDGTAIYFTALPNCLMFHDCESCLNSDTGFSCLWCEGVQRCSDGVDRYRQSWLSNECIQKKEKIQCSAPKPSTSESRPSSSTSSDVKPTVSSTKSPAVSSTGRSEYSTGANDQSIMPAHSKQTNQDTDVVHSARVDVHSEKMSSSSIGPGAIAAILLIITIVIGIGFWIGYAYKYPQTPSGQFLIKYRPSQWNFRQGETGYSAASIHI